MRTDPLSAAQRRKGPHLRALRRGEGRACQNVTGASVSLVGGVAWLTSSGVAVSEGASEPVYCEYAVGDAVALAGTWLPAGGGVSGASAGLSPQAASSSAAAAATNK